VTDAVAATGIDALALKPTEDAVTRALDVPVDGVTVDYEGRDALPDAADLRALAEEKWVRVTTPVRADGFDPRGDDGLVDWIPDGVGRVLVAGNPPTSPSRRASVPPARLIPTPGSAPRASNASRSSSAGRSTNSSRGRPDGTAGRSAPRG
jgi:hypothetical protein